MFRVFIGFFIIVGAAHLVLLFLGKNIPRNITKICLLPLLAGAYVSGAKNIFVPALLALFFGWWGDLFLLKISDIKFFRLGLGSFLAGHFFYIVTFIFFTNAINNIALAVSVAAAIPLVFIVHSIIRPKKELNIPVIVYEIIITLMSLSALQLMLSRGDVYGLLVFAGSICFLLSDTSLGYITFRTRSKYASLFVMLSYIAAQLTIVLGLIGSGPPAAL
ncbi:MAG: lysoplasmalogenase [Treponema sp.]|jgi:uncharacterized membrane protein YhhN|nr:lysoplasmalogenase [Treponema sp.]